MIFAALIFSNFGWLWPALVVTIAAAAAVIWFYRGHWRESRWFGVAAAAKLLSLSLLALCLGEPLWSSTQVRPGANQFLIVADNSRSLQLKDAGESTSRGNELSNILNDRKADWQVRLEQDFAVRRYQFAGLPKYVADFHGLDFQGDRTQLNQSLKSLRERLTQLPVAGILLFSDGISTDPIDPADIHGLPPIYPVPIGRSKDLRDLAISGVTATTTAFEDAPVTLQVALQCTGLDETSVIVRIDDDEGHPVQHEVQKFDGGARPLGFRFQLKPTRAGITFYRVRAAIGDQLGDFDDANLSNEVTLQNNSRTVVVDRGNGPYRLLYVSGRPNWELKFLRRALANDEQLQLTAIVRIAKKEAKFDFRGRDGENANSLFRGFDRVDETTESYDQPVLVRLNTQTPEELRDGFPKTAEDLYRFHAIILDDVEASFFTADQLALMEKFVSERGGGFLMLGGAESLHEGRYAQTAVGRLLPVYLDKNSTLPPAPGYRLALSRDGWLQPWARLRATESDEVGRYRTLPPVRVLNAVSGIKPGASVIAEVLDPQGRKFPALVEQRYGRGRSAVVLPGDLWRAQLEQTDEQREKDDLAKSWRQLLRWLIVDVPDRVDILPVPDDSTGIPVMRLETRVRNNEFRPQDNAEVSIEVQAPDGTTYSMMAEPSLREAGLYEASLASRPQGAWQAVATAVSPEGKTLGTAVTGWAVDLMADELKQLAPDRQRLSELAKLTGGKIVEIDELPRFVTTLSSRDAPVTEVRSTPLWHSPLVWLVLIAGMCVEWGIRRRHGLP